MQCAGRATAHREPLVDGKIRKPVNVIRLQPVSDLLLHEEAVNC